jgi:hypothetical protein
MPCASIRQSGKRVSGKCGDWKMDLMRSLQKNSGMARQAWRTRCQGVCRTVVDYFNTLEGGHPNLKDHITGHEQNVNEWLAFGNKFVGNDWWRCGWMAQDLVRDQTLKFNCENTHDERTLVFSTLASFNYMMGDRLCSDGSPSKAK